MRQIWRHLGFLHWPVDARRDRSGAPARPRARHVRRRRVSRASFPSPFRCRARRGSGCRIAPAFHEVNLRTYVHRGGRDPGVWFFSLDAASRLAVTGARAGYHLPYFRAQMTMKRSDGPGVIGYRSRRIGAGPRRRIFRPVWYRTERRGRPSGRWPSSWPSGTCFTPRMGGCCRARASSTRRIRSRRVLRPRCARRWRAAAGLAPTSGPPTLVHYAEEVDVRIVRASAVPM